MARFPFYPKVFQEVLSNIPTIAFKTVEWKDFISSSQKIVKKLVTKDYGKELIPQLRKLMGQDFLIDLDARKLSHRNKVTGESTLRLYFTQFQNPYGAFLDLRSHHFGQDEEETIFKPSPVWHCYSEEFRSNMIVLYKAFYYSDEQRFTQSLENLGLTAGCDQEQVEELKSLFYQHFGTETGEVSFNVDQFNESFMKIFSFFMENEIRLSSDFLHLGSNLITLYMHLEEYQTTFNVEKIFKEVYPSSL